MRKSGVLKSHCDVRPKVVSSQIPNVDPSIVIEPPVTSYNLVVRAVRVVLPLPVSPISATD